MCGIAGLLGDFPAGAPAAMGARIAHRGPDDQGLHLDAEAGLALIHRRLSILDLSPAGHQPMASRSGRYWICYNGEVYNFPELKRELEGRGHVFRSQCDTEAIVELFERDGPACFARLNGIFAFAIWDVKERSLLLVRDGMGVKPLYLARLPAGYAFASEIKALLDLPGLDRTLDPIAAASYLSYLWTPGARTMFRSVEKVAPGHWLRLRRGRPVEQGRFYQLPDPDPVVRPDSELIAGTEAALRTAVERQMLADVEVGAFLSGGLDSSAIVAFAREHAASGPLRCFTIDYRAKGSEAGELIADLPYAREAAAHLGVQLDEVVVDAGMAGDFERLVYHLDEPEADPAALNSLYIAELARERGIKVLLSGTGGDDLFTGYRRHHAARLDRLLGRTPRPLRALMEGVGSRLPGSSTRMRRLRKLFDGIAAPEALRLTRLFEWLPPEAALELLDRPAADAAIVRAPLDQALDELAGHDPVERVLRLDQLFFLTDHNLNYADKTGMAAGVEIRVPFLDPDLVAWAARLPTSAKLRGRETKWVLRKAMEPHLPRNVIYRPKTGFGVPLRAWLKAEMRPMLEELTARPVLESRGLFNADAVARLKADTEAGRRDGSYALLGVMAIELWCRRFAAPPPAATEPQPLALAAG